MTMRTGIVDADGHVTESSEQLARYIDPAYRNYGSTRGARAAYYPTDGWDRSVRGTLGDHGADATAWLAAIDRGGVEVTVLYPTAGLSIGWVREPDVAVAVCRAYDDFFHQEFMAKSPRLKGVALLPLQDVPAAVAELRRAHGLGFVGAMLPAVGLRKPLGHQDFWPIYAEAERLGTMVGVHATVRGPQFFGGDLFDSFVEVHTLSHAFAQMIQMTSMTFQGVFEAFPRLKVAFLEAGCTWVPYWLGRMDEEWEKRGALEAPRCTRKPSEYLTSDRVFYPTEAGEWLLGPTSEVLGQAGIFYASDWPHWDNEFPANIHHLQGRKDVSDELKRQILSGTARRLYGLDG